MTSFSEMSAEKAHDIKTIIKATHAGLSKNMATDCIFDIFEEALDHIDKLMAVVIDVSNSYDLEAFSESLMRLLKHRIDHAVSKQRFKEKYTQIKNKDT